jgi:phenylalanyl-tRNA synthetase alpha subunit
MVGEIHPTRSMHDTTYFSPVHYSLYEPRVSADGSLVEHQTFKSKEHLQFAISRWHIEKN